MRERNSSLSIALLAASAASFLAASARAQAVAGRYIVEFDSEPAVTAAPGGRLAQAAARIAARRAQIQAEHVAQEAAIRTLGGGVLRRYDTVFNGMAVQIADQSAPRLRALPGVRAVYPDKRFHTVLDQAVMAQRVTGAWASLPGGITSAGAGTMIAILDTGIDVNHPGFQGFAASLPSGFPITSSSAEAAHTNNKIIVSRDYVGTGGMDMEGHGTGVAMIAAGLTNSATLNCADPAVAFCSSSIVYPENPITGVAPGAWLGNYKVCDDSGACYLSTLLAALGDLVNDAAALQAATDSTTPLVVANYSAGGPSLFMADESGAEARAIHNAVAAGVLVVAAAGNDGQDPNGGQAPNSMGVPGLVPDAISVGAVFNQRIFDYAVNVAGMTPLQASIPDISMDSNSPDLFDPVTAPIVDIAQIDGNGLACDTLAGGSLTGKIAVIQRGTCSFNTKLNNAAVAGAAGAVVYNNQDTGLLNMVLSNASLPALFISQTGGQNLKSAIAGGSGATATLDFAGLTPFPLGTSDLIATYSAAGPTSGGNIKPDLLAVGGDYVALDCAGLDVLDAQVLTADATANDPMNPYTIGAGTSFATPFVTGSLAVLESARPGLAAAQYRSLVVNSAPQFTSAVDGTLGTPMVVGSGKLDLLGALQNNLAAVPSSLNFQTAVGQVNNTLPLAVTNLGASPDTFTVTVNPIDGSISPSVDVATFSLSPGASQTINVAMSGSGLAASVYDGYLSITGTQTNVATRIGYWFGVPGSAVQNVTVLNQNELNGGGVPLESGLSILIRYTDQIGMPIAGPAPTVTALAARSKVVKVAPLGDIPGTYEVDIQLGRVSFTYDEFDIAVGSVTASVYVPVF